MSANVSYDDKGMNDMLSWGDEQGGGLPLLDMVDILYPTFSAQVAHISTDILVEWDV